MAKRGNGRFGPLSGGNPALPNDVIRNDVIRSETMAEKIYQIPAEWTQRAFIDNAKYEAMYATSIKDPNAFWGEQAKRIDWIKPFSKVKNSSYDPAHVSIKWFEDGVLNVAY